MNINSPIAYPWRANLKGGVARYFLNHDEACRCPGRIGPPEFAPDDEAFGPRPEWLINNYIASQLVWC